MELKSEQLSQLVSLGGWLRMPFALVATVTQFEREKPQRQAHRLPPIHQYRDAHEAERSAGLPGDQRDGGRGDDAEADGLDAHRGEAGDQGGFDHLAGAPRVAADDDFAAAFRGERARGSDGEAQCGLGRHRGLVDPSTDSVCAEILPRHAEPLRRQSGVTSPYTMKSGLS